MAYDRYDRDERSRWSDERAERGWRERDPGRRHERDERGFFERAGDEIASWFGDDDAERRRHQDRIRDEREHGWSGRGYQRGSWRDDDRERGFGRSSERDDNPRWRRELWGGGESPRSPERDYGRPSDEGRSYRPMTGDYGRGERESGHGFAGGGFGRGESRSGGFDRFGGYDRSETPYGRDDYRRTSFAGSRKDDRDFDPHYRSWREQHLSELDRDYDEYRRENRSRFESEFGSWRERRQQKRALLGQIREDMEVVSRDDERIGTVERIAGDRIILAKSDPESGGVHHSLSCSDIDRVEGDRVILDCSAEEARRRWRDESRSRALFEREDQGEMGPRMLDRSFEGTYR
ncbi:MAG TPA: DUF2171 domain-containing protein [Sphingomicrobium sp.]|nr:DUF2171 domain-containing protein [Sphingomicrobium sp.]